MAQASETYTRYCSRVSGAEHTTDTGDRGDGSGGAGSRHEQATSVTRTG